MLELIAWIIVIAVLVSIYDWLGSLMWWLVGFWAFASALYLWDKYKFKTNMPANDINTVKTVRREIRMGRRTKLNKYIEELNFLGDYALLSNKYNTNFDGPMPDLPRQEKQKLGEILNADNEFCTRMRLAMQGLRQAISDKIERSKKFSATLWLTQACMDPDVNTFLIITIGLDAIAHLIFKANSDGFLTLYALWGFVSSTALLLKTGSDQTKEIKDITNILNNIKKDCRVDLLDGSSIIKELAKSLNKSLNFAKKASLNNLESSTQEQRMNKMQNELSTALRDFLLLSTAENARYAQAAQTGEHIVPLKEQMIVALQDGKTRNLLITTSSELTAKKYINVITKSDTKEAIIAYSDLLNNISRIDQWLVGWLKKSLELSLHLGQLIKAKKDNADIQVINYYKNFEKAGSILAGNTEPDKEKEKHEIAKSKMAVQRKAARLTEHLTD